MDFQPRDLITIIGGAVSLTGLYYALKRDVVKVSSALGKVESYHKREVTMLSESIKDTKNVPGCYIIQNLTENVVNKR